MTIIILKSHKFESLQFSCTSCIVATLTDCETSKDESSNSLRTFLFSLKFFLTFTVSELFSKNWFDATNLFSNQLKLWFEI